MEDYFSFQELIKVIRYDDLILHPVVPGILRFIRDFYNLPIVLPATDGSQLFQ